MLFLPVASVRYFLTLEKNLDLVAQTLLLSWEHIPMEEWKKLILGIFCFSTLVIGAWSPINNLRNCNKVEPDKIQKYNEKLTQKRKNLKNASRLICLSYCLTSTDHTACLGCMVDAA